MAQCYSSPGHLHLSTALLPQACKGQGLHNLKQMDYKNRPQFSCIPATHMRVLASTTASTIVMVDLLRQRPDQVSQRGQCRVQPGHQSPGSKNGHVRQGGKPSLAQTSALHQTNQTRSRWTQPHTSVYWPAHQIHQVHNQWKPIQGTPHLRSVAHRTPIHKSPPSRSNSEAIRGISCLKSHLYTHAHTSSGLTLES